MPRAWPLVAIVILGGCGFDANSGPMACSDPYNVVGGYHPDRFATPEGVLEALPNRGLRRYSSTERTVTFLSEDRKVKVTVSRVGDKPWRVTSHHECH